MHQFAQFFKSEEGLPEFIPIGRVHPYCLLDFIYLRCKTFPLLVANS